MMTTETDSSPQQRCGFVAIIGATNAGKSTLMNTLIGAKVSIVSRKVQTTRQQIRGIAIQNQSQIVFIDTPGFFNPRRRLDKAMLRSAWGSTRDADIVGLIIDANRVDEERLTPILEELTRIRRPTFLILNKIDLIDRKTLLELTHTLNKKHKFEHSFMISALKGDGCSAILNWLETRVPEGVWHYPEDQISDIADREMASEITRENIYDRLHEELPYDTTCETTQWLRKKDGSVRIEQTITVARDSQKKIVLGKNGDTIKAISTSSRHQMMQIFECKVHLFLFVKVRENWSDDPELYRRMGLEWSE